MSAQAPAYQMYAGDWLKSRNVRLMADYQRGWYIQLLNEAWDGKPQCMLPNDTELLQVLAGVSDLARSQPSFNDRWTAVQNMFKHDGEYVYNERQLEELAEQQRRREIAIRAGNASAKKREEHRKELQRLKKQHLAEGNGRSTVVDSTFNGNPTLLTPSPSPSPPSTSAPPVDPPKPPKGGRRKAGFKGWTIEDLRQDVAKANDDNLLTEAECADFVEYWTEQTNTGRFKFSLNPTWSTRRRMQTALRMVYEKQRADHPATMPAPPDTRPAWQQAGAPTKKEYDRDQEARRKERERQDLIWQR